MERTSQISTNLTPDPLVLTKNFSLQPPSLSQNFTNLHTHCRAAVTVTYVDGSTEMPQVNKIGSMGPSPQYVTVRRDDQEQAISEITSMLPPGITLDKNYSNFTKNTQNSESNSSSDDQSTKINETDQIKLHGKLVFVKDHKIQQNKNSHSEIIIHENIYTHFGHEKCVDAIAKNQTILKSKRGLIDRQMLENEQDIIEFLKQSERFNHIENIQKLAEGGEAIIFKINYNGFEEVVIKVPLIKYQTQLGYSDLIQETHLIKSIYHEDYIVEIKEELIEIDEITHGILRYCVVVERAKHSLYDLYSLRTSDTQSTKKSGLWFDDKFRQEQLESFSLSKFIYYFYQTLEALTYLHENGIIYQDMKPQNLLVMRNQKLKLGDFGISIILNQKSKEQKYKLKGLSPDWCLPALAQIFTKQKDIIWALCFDENTLKRNDEFGVGLTFSPDLIQDIQRELQIDKSTLNFSEQDLKHIQYISNILNELIITRQVSLEQAKDKLALYLNQNLDIINDYLQQLLLEKKYQGAYEVGKFLEREAKNLQGVDESKKNPQYMKVFQMMGEFKFMDGDFLQALQHLDKAEQIYNDHSRQMLLSEVRGEVESSWIDILQLKAKTYLNLNQMDQAYKYFKQGIDLFKSDQAKYQQKILNIIDLQGQMALAQNNYPEAIKAFDQYFQIVKSSAKIEVQIKSRINAHKNMGVLCYKMKQFDTSMLNFQSALDLMIEEHGQDHPNNIELMKNIGNIHIQNRDFEKANEIISKALKISQTIYGERNTFTAETYRQMGDILSQANQDEALQKYQKALKIYQSIYGSDSIHSVVIYNNMAGMFLASKDLQKSEEYCQKSLDISLQQSIQQDSLNIASIYENYCKVKLAQQNFPQALEYAQKSFTIRNKLLTTFHTETIQSFMIYVALLSQIGQNAQAIVQCEQVYNAAKLQYGDEHEIIMKLTQLLSQLKLKAGNINQSKQLLIQNLKYLELQPGELNNRMKFDTLLKLGQNYEKIGSVEAIKYYQKALEFCPSPAFEFELHRCIAFFYCKNHQIVEGLEYLIKAEQILLKNKDKDPLFAQFENNFLKPIQELKSRCEKVISFKKHNSHALNVQ
eukprot:403373474